tara:strand:- start:657 stop:833 length:177 start_codon:yes stop_codon:yes gene_type:complete
MSSSVKTFLDKFFDLCSKYQEEIPHQMMAEILRDYAYILDIEYEMLMNQIFKPSGYKT